MIDRLLSINFCWRVTRRANSRQFLFHQTKRAIAQCSMFDVRCPMFIVHCPMLMTQSAGYSKRRLPLVTCCQGSSPDLDNPRHLLIDHVIP